MALYKVLLAILFRKYPHKEEWTEMKNIFILLTQTQKDKILNVLQMKILASQFFYAHVFMWKYCGKRSGTRKGFMRGERALGEGNYRKIEGDC